jgi:hypothetical protein
VFSTTGSLNGISILLAEALAGDSEAIRSDVSDNNTISGRLQRRLTTVLGRPVMAIVKRALSIFNPTANDSMLAPACTAIERHPAFCYPEQVWTVLYQKEVIGSQGVAVLTSASKDACNSVDHSRLVSHKG